MIDGGIGAVLIGVGIFAAAAFMKGENKEADNSPYLLSDKGWTDGHHQLNHDVRDFNIMQKDERGEWEVLYKGRVTGDTRPARYTDADIDYVDEFDSIHFTDGFVLHKYDGVRTDYHKYYDVQAQFPTFSREWEAEKFAITNGYPSLAEIQQFDIIDIRHKNTQMQYMKFKKGTAPYKYRKHVITGISKEGPITKAIINNYKDWGMEPPQPLAEDPPLRPILSPFAQEAPVKKSWWNDNWED